MKSKNFKFSWLKKLMAVAVLFTSATAFSQIDTYEVGDMGYLRSPMESKSGIVLSNNRYSEIYLFKDSKLTTLVSGRGCGIYTQMSKDKQLIGFKSFNEDDMQAPAILNVETGKVTLLEDYCHQCGQVSFSNDGTMAYTMGNTLIIRKGESRKSYDLGFYTNIANISPDGSQVAYSNIDGRMFVINLATSVVEQIAVTDGYNGVWSPDGSKLAVHVADGTLSVVDRSNNKIYALGQGISASWANNSTELVYTTIDGTNEMLVTGSSIKKVNFDGTNKVTLVASSDNMPTDAILTSDNQLVVSYSTGSKRGLAMRKLPLGKITTQSVSQAQETTLYSIGEDDLFGKRLGDICDTPLRKKPSKEISTKALQQKIGALDIPYLSQIYDSPSVSGCTRWGYVSCAPTSACMYLGYFGLLDPVATTSRYDGTTKYYAHHIGNTFTNQAGTYTFNLTHYKYCATISGAYGYMWNTNSPQYHIEDFMKLNGCTSTEKTYSSSTAWTTFQTEATAGRPYLICVKLGSSSGHVILGFATNCKYRSASGFIEQTGSFVCHDPYGDYNDSSWPDGDGQHSTYDWVGYNNGQGNIGTYYWSVSAVPPTTTSTATPELTVSKESITLSGEYGASDAPYVDVTVTGENLTSDIVYNPNNSAVSVSTLSGWDARTGGTLRITLNTEYVLGAGEYTGYVAVQSTSSYRKTIAYTVTLTGSSSSDTEEGSTTDVISSLTEGWNYSETSANTADWVTTGAQGIEDIAFKGGKLYAVCRGTGISDHSICIVDAYTGKKTGELNTENCTVGTYDLSAIETLGNSIIACNLTGSEDTNFVIYKWSSDSDEPTKMLDAALPGSGIRFGDAMSVSGDETDGKIWFVSGSNAYYYTVTNGEIASTTPTTIALTKDDAAYDITSSTYAINVEVESDGSFWVSTKEYISTHFSSTGTYIETMSSTALDEKRGTDLKFFTLGSKKYAIATKYLNTTATALSEGAFALLDVTSGVSSAAQIATYPTSGLGSTRNTSFRTSLCYEVTSTHVNVWVSVPFQGAAYYTFQHTVPGTTTEASTLNAEQASLVFDECYTGSTLYEDVVVTGANLHSVCSISSDSDEFAVVDNTTWNSTDLSVSGSVRILFKPTEAGVYSGTISITSLGSDGQNITTTIAVSGTAVVNKTVDDDNVTALTEVWNYSVATANDGGWVTLSSVGTNDMAYKDGKLYVVNRVASDNSDNKIYIVDAYTGAKLGELNTASCDEGTHYISAIEALGESIIACNLVVANSTTKFIVYKWDSDDAEPTELLRTDAFSSDFRVGDAMTATGTLEDGAIWFVYDSTVFSYSIKDGECSSEATSVTLKKKSSDGTTETEYSISSGTAVSHVTVEEDGSFWVCAKDALPTHFTPDGYYIGEISETVVGNKQGTDLVVIELGTRKYAVATTYLNTTESTLSDGAFTLMDITDGLDSATKIETYPSAGLGGVRNTSFRTTLCANVDDENMNVWVLFPYQGAAYYKFKHSEVSTSIEEVGVDADAPVEYYNLQGIRVVNPANGLFIKKQGTKTTKVIL